MNFLYKKLIILSILIVIAICSCNSKKNIKIPKTLEKINPEKFDDSTNLKNKNFILLHYINGNCSKCLFDLKYWKEFRNKNKNKFKFLFIISSRSKVLSKYYIKKIKLNIPVYYDRNQIFKKTNWKHLKKMNTYLLDKDHKIIFGGNPIYNNNLENQYLREINKRVKK